MLSVDIVTFIVWSSVSVEKLVDEAEMQFGKGKRRCQTFVRPCRLCFLRKVDRVGGQMWWSEYKGQHTAEVHQQAKIYTLLEWRLTRPQKGIYEIFFTCLMHCGGFNCIGSKGFHRNSSPLQSLLLYRAQIRWQSISQSIGQSIKQVTNNCLSNSNSWAENLREA